MRWGWRGWAFGVGLVFAGSCGELGASGAATQVDASHSSQACFCLSCCAGGTGCEMDCATARWVYEASAPAKPLLDGQTVNIDLSAVSDGGAVDIAFGIKNSAGPLTAAALIVESVQLAYALSSGAQSEAVPAIECLHDNATQSCAAVNATKSWKTVVPAPYVPKFGSLVETFVLRFHRYDDLPRTATLTIKFSGASFGQSPMSLEIRTHVALGKLTLSPADGVTWPYVEPGKSQIGTFSVVNTAPTDLELKGLQLVQASPAFKVRLTDPADLDATIYPGGTAPWTFAKPLTLAPNQKATFQVTFTSTDSQKHTGTVVFLASDPSPPTLTLSAGGP